MGAESSSRADDDRFKLGTRSMRRIDSMTMSAPWTRVNFGGAYQPKGPGERSRYADYRSRLPPGLSTNCFCGYRNRGTARAATGPSRGSGEVLPCAGAPGKESARGDGSQWTCALVRATAGRTER